MEGFDIIRSGRKTLAVEITKDCRVLVRAPYQATQDEIDAFIARNIRWIIDHLGKQLQRSAAAPPPPSEDEIAELKAKARAFLPGRVAYWSEQTGLTPTGIRITTAKGRYGSCSAKNSLSFSCFLMRHPEEAIDLVVVHELCHIQEKNHGKQFYALLERYLPDHKERKKLLKQGENPS